MEEEETGRGTASHPVCVEGNIIPCQTIHVYLFFKGNQRNIINENSKEKFKLFMMMNNRKKNIYVYLVKEIINTSCPPRNRT